MTDIEDVESGALAKFRGLQKKAEIGEWLALKPGWVDWLAPKEEGQRKSDGHKIGAKPSNVGGVRDAVFNNVVYPQLRIMERLIEMVAAVLSDNHRCPLATDGR